MTREDLDKYPCSYVGLLKIVKPRKGQKIGIAYADWHHLAIIDDVVFTFVWDTREIIDCCPLQFLQNFEAVNIADLGTHLKIGNQTSTRAKTTALELLDKYDILPIIQSSKVTITDLRESAIDALKTVNTEIFNIDNDASVVFMNKDFELPDNMFMYKQGTTLNPSKLKFVDNYAYQGRSKYLAIVARCYILKQIENLNA